MGCYIAFRHKDGRNMNVPMSLYRLNSRNEMFVVIAADFGNNYEEIEIITDFDNLQFSFAGKLNEQDYINKNRIMATLLSDGWDWQKYPDPEIVLLKNLDPNCSIIF